jgi:C4-dicarboxylate transporter DctM subunit
VLQAVVWVFGVGMIIGMPLVLLIILASVTPWLVNPNFIADADFVIRSIVGGGDSTTLLAAPLFIISGVIMSKGGISERIFDVFFYLLGRMKGGIPCAVVMTSLFYGTISGSGIATAAAVGSMTIPLMLRMGYDPRYAGAIVAVSSGLGVIIPPSIPFIMFGLATGTSIGELFIAGILPGILIALLLMAYAVIYALVRGENRSKIDETYLTIKRRGFWDVFKNSIWALLSPVILLGGIYSGIVTPTEVACVSVFYVIIVSVFIYKTVKPGEIIGLFAESARILAPLALMFAAAIALGRVFTLLKVPTTLSNYIVSHFNSDLSILIAVSIAMLLIGMVMDTGPVILIFAPMLMPLAGMLGIDPVHLGVIMIINMAIGFVTPPFGVSLFVTSPMVQRSPMQVAWRATPLILVLLMALAVIIAVPEISLLLVK